MISQFEFEPRYNSTLDIRVYAHFNTKTISTQNTRQQDYNLILDLMINIMQLAKELKAGIAKDIPKDIDVRGADICISSTLFFNSKQEMNSFLEIIQNLLN